MRTANELQALYRRTSGAVAFIDESFNLENGRAYYILAATIVDSADLLETRQALQVFYGGLTLHASPMFANGEVHSLRRAIDLVAAQHDGLDIVVQQTIDPQDTDGRVARTFCLAQIMRKLHAEFGCELFILDSSNNRMTNASDLETTSKLRHTGLLSRETTVTHTFPRLEPLLGMPDVVAWAYRQELTGRSTAWFDPLREQAHVTFIAQRSAERTRT